GRGSPDPLSRHKGIFFGFEPPGMCVLIHLIQAPVSSFRSSPYVDSRCRNINAILDIRHLDYSNLDSHLSLFAILLFTKTSIVVTQTIIVFSLLSTLEIVSRLRRPTREIRGPPSCQ